MPQVWPRLQRVFLWSMSDPEQSTLPPHMASLPSRPLRHGLLNEAMLTNRANLAPGPTVWLGDRELARRAHGLGPTPCALVTSAVYLPFCYLSRGPPRSSLLQDGEPVLSATVPRAEHGVRTSRGTVTAHQADLLGIVRRCEQLNVLHHAQ